MLQGANWARWLFVVEAVLGSAAMTYFFSDNIKPMVTTFVFRVICIVILFLPAANRYFESRSRAGR